MREDVADAIRNGILTGELRRGSRLDILAIAADMGVSQLPVREALLALSSEGLVRSEARRGYYVEKLDRADVLDHYEIYGKISGMAAARATGTLSEEEIGHLDQINSQMQETPDVAEQEHLNNEFHRLLNVSGGSRRLRSVLRPLSRGMDVRFATIIPGWQANAALEHGSIIAALRAHDPDAAREAMEQHLIVNGRRAADALERAGFFTSDGAGDTAP